MIYLNDLSELTTQKYQAQMVMFASFLPLDYWRTEASIGCFNGEAKRLNQYYMSLSSIENKPTIENLSIKSFGFMIILICTIACLCYLIRAASIGMFTRVEGCFCESAREMLQAQNYVVPIYYGREFFDKPILTYWLIILFYKMIGVSVFAGRLPSIISAVLSIGLVGYFSRRVYGNTVGIFSAAILATCIGFSDMASVAMSDMLLCLFEFMSIASFYLGLVDDNKKSKWYLIASVAMALGFLTKGFVAVVFPLTTLVIFLLFSKQSMRIGLKDFLVCVGAFIAIVLPWHIMLFNQCGLQALNWMYLHEQIQRFSGSITVYDFKHPIFYMICSVFSQILPWSIFLPVVIWELSKNLKHADHIEQRRCTLMLCVFVVLHVVFFSLSKSNWGYYNLPACPAASILIGQGLSSWFNSRSNLISIRSFVLPIAIFTGACIFSLIGSFFLIMKINHEAQHSFAEIIASKYPKNPLVIHTNLFGQYFLCDYVLFKSTHMPIYASQDQVISDLGSDSAVCTILPKDNFDSFPKILKDKVIVLATAKYKCTLFPSCLLKTEPGTDHKITLVLVTNASNK